MRALQGLSGNIMEPRGGERGVSGGAGEYHGPMTARKRSERDERSEREEVDRRTKLYWRLVRNMARDVYRSDGCSGVPDFRLDACLEHNLHYRTGRRWAVHGEEVETLGGESTTVPRLMAFEIVTRDWADRRFRHVNQRLSRFGRWSPMAWWRWLGVAYLPLSSGAWYRYRTEGTYDDITAEHLWQRHQK